MSDSPRRRFVLHIGTGKTGSSALQVDLARNRARLQELDAIHYPAHASDSRALQGEVVSGNAVGIDQFIVSERLLRTGERPDRHVVTEPLTATDTECILYSSETMWSLDPEERRIEALQEILDDHHAQLEVAVFIRDVAGHALSSYSQMVKRHRYTQSFEQFIGMRPTGRVYQNRLRERLEYLETSLGIDNLHVLHYNSCKDALLTNFLTRALNVGDAGAYESTAGSVNRSLTLAELDLMRRVNRRVKTNRDATALSNALISLPPLGASEYTLEEECLEHLRSDFDEDVSWINDRFFPDTRPVSVLGNDVQVESSGPHPRPPSPEMRFLLDWIGAIAPRVKL